MAFELYKRQAIPRGDPAVTITKMGRLSLNLAATRFFEERKATHVQLLWDAETSRIALKICDPKAEAAYTLTFADKGNGAGFSAVTFLNFLEYDWTQSRVYVGEWDNANLMFVFSVPKEHLGKPVPRGYAGKGESLRRIKTP